jgi:signal transduction histidine kinase
VTQATEARTRLIRGVTHDVKNPLGAADGYAQLLELGLQGELLPEQVKLVAGVRRGIHSALAIITDLLDLSLAESGGLPVHRLPVDLTALAAEAMEDYRGAAEAAGHELAWDGGACMPLDTDPVRVREVLGNILSNAVKYTPAPGRITVWTEVVPDGGGPRPGRWAAAHVRDSGPGIPPAERERVFSEFHRLHTAEQASGHGLGLAISRLMARLLGGELTVAGEPGEGATFSLWVPADLETA